MYAIRSYYEASELAEILRSLVEQSDFDLPEPLTASFGVAEYRRDERREDFIARVDQQLYLAKQQGALCLPAKSDGGNFRRVNVKAQIGSVDHDGSTCSTKVTRLISAT